MKMTRKAPVIIFAYNRYAHTKRTIEALCKNVLAKETDIYIMVDYIDNDEQRKATQDLYDYLNDDTWKQNFQSVDILYANVHRGLAKSVINGVTRIISQYDRVIVLEDDIVTETIFLQYMNDCLNFYQDNEKIWSISGWAVPDSRITGLEESVYLSYRASSWGWATWKDRWETIDWNIHDYSKFKYNLLKRRHFNRGGADLAFMLDRQMKGDIDSWAVRWCYNQSVQNRDTVYPTRTLVENIGCDGSGTHYTSPVQNDVHAKTDVMNEYHLQTLYMDKRLSKIFYLYYSGTMVQRFKKCLITVFYHLGLLQYVINLKRKIRE